MDLNKKMNLMNEWDIGIWGHLSQNGKNPDCKPVCPPFLDVG